MDITYTKDRKRGEKMDELNSYYKDQLIDQLESLIELCASYDSGNFTRAKGMSAIIRTMVKDPIPRSGKKSDTVSLLKTLNIKDDMKFYNTAYEAVDPEFMFNLVGFVTVPTKNVKEHFALEHIYLPVFENSTQVDCEWLDFENWWTAKVLVSKSESKNIILSRKDIVLRLAEQFGGVHVDEVKAGNRDYFDLVTSRYSILTHVYKEQQEAIKYLPYALVRQIAHEVIVSLKNKLNLTIVYNPTNKNNLRGIPESNIRQPGMFSESTKAYSKHTKKPFRLAKQTVIKSPPNAAYVKLFF